MEDFLEVEKWREQMLLLDRELEHPAEVTTREQKNIEPTVFPLATVEVSKRTNFIKG